MWVLLALALGARLLTLPLSLGLRLYGDESYYTHMAAALVGRGPMVIPFGSGQRDLLFWWGPGQGVLLVPAILAGGGPVVARLTVALVSALTVVPLYAITRQQFGEKAALWAGLLFALLPGFVLFAHYLWAENLFGLLALSAVWLTYRRKPWGSGALWGLCMLTRPLTLSWLPWVAAWSHYALGRSGRRFAAWALACGALIISYSAFNSVRAGHPVLIVDPVAYYKSWRDGPWMSVEPSTPQNMFAQAARMKEQLSSARRSPDEHRRRAAAFGFGVVWREPGRFIIRGIKRVGWTWGPYTFPMMRISHGEYAALGTGRLVIGAMAMLKAAHVLTLILILPGIVLGWRSDYAKLVPGLFLATSAVCFVLLGVSRYGYPVLILAMPLAGLSAARAVAGIKAHATGATISGQGRGTPPA